jgi:hypothetical protein
MSLLCHRKIPRFSTLQGMSNNVTLAYETSETMRILSFSGKKYLIFKYLVYPVSSKLPSYLSVISQNPNYNTVKASLIACILKKVHQNWITGSKVTVVSIEPFFPHRVLFTPPSRAQTSKGAKWNKRAICGLDKSTIPHTYFWDRRHPLTSRRKKHVP